MGSRKIITLIGAAVSSATCVIALGEASTASAQAPAGASGGTPTAKFTVSAFAGTYAQSSFNSSVSAADDGAAVKLQGEAITAAAMIFGTQAELGWASYKAKSASYFDNRQETTFSLAPRISASPWLMPSIGYYQMAQHADRTRDDAPLAFIDQTSALSLGVRGEVVPLLVAGHGLILQLRYDYLTNGEARGNFGDTRQISVGYIFKNGSFEMGLRAGIARTFLNASRTQKKTNADGVETDVERGVRSIVEGNIITLFMNF